MSFLSTDFVDQLGIHKVTAAVLLRQLRAAGVLVPLREPAAAAQPCSRSANC